MPAEIFSEVESAESRVLSCRESKVQAEAAHTKARQIHIENVGKGARPSEIARSRKELTEAENALDDADIALQAAGDALIEARAKVAARRESERLAALDTLWQRKNTAGLRLNELLEQMATAAREFEQPDREILSLVPGDHKAGTRDLLERIAQGFVPALVASISPRNAPSLLALPIENYRPRWNRPNPEVFWKGKPE